MTLIEQYREARRSPEVIRDNGDYNLLAGEMNPEIYRRFAKHASDMGVGRAFEPFAAPDGRGFQYFLNEGIDFVAYSLEPADRRVNSRDSTKEPVDDELRPVGAVVLHPPYYGSAPLSRDSRELSLVESKDEWQKYITRAAENIIDSMTSHGCICIIGRRYRYHGENIRLEEWMLNAFDDVIDKRTSHKDAVEIYDVWLSTPDVVVILNVRLS